VRALVCLWLTLLFYRMEGGTGGAPGRIGSVCRPAHLLGGKGSTCLDALHHVVSDEQGGSDGDGDGSKALHGSWLSELSVVYRVEGGQCPPCCVCSHTVQHLVDGIEVVCLSLKGATVDRARVHVGGCRFVDHVTTLIDHLLAVGVAVHGWLVEL
jgi:hypothetical protein